MPEIKDLFAEKRKEIDKKVKGYQTVPLQTPIPKIKTEPIEQQQIEQEIEQQPIPKKPPQKTEAPLSDYDIIRQRREDAIKEISAFEQHRQRLNELDKTTPIPKEQYEYKGVTEGEYGAYIGQQKEKEKEAQRVEQGIKEQGIEFIKQERLKKQYEEQQKIKDLQQNLNPDIDKKIKEYEEKQPSYFDQFSLIHKRAKDEDEQLHYDVVSELYDNDRRNYAIAKNVLQDTKSLLNAPTKTEGGAFFKSAGNEIKQLDTWVTISGLGDNLQKSSVVKFAQTGKPLTKSEESLLDAIFDYYYVSNERAGNISKAYAAGQMAGKSIPFMIDFVMTGGFASGATGGFGKVMAKRVEAKLIEKLGEATYKKLTKTGVDRLIKAPFKAAEELTAGAMQAPMTPTFYSSVTEEVMPKPIEKKEGGGYVYQQGTPIKDAIIRGMNEVIFERSGEFIGDVFSPLGKALASTNYFNKIKSTKLKNFNRVLYGGIGTFAETLKKTGFNGMPLEMGEEVFGQLANYVMGASTKEEMDEFFSKDNFQTMLMGFAPMTGVAVAGNMAQRGMINYNHKKATANINNDFGDKAKDVISALNETSPDRLQDIFDEIMLNNDGYEGNKLTDKGKVMAKDMLRYVYTKAQVESVKGIDQDNYKATGAPKNAVNEMQDGKHTVALLDAQGNIIVQKQFENEDAAEKYKQKLNEMYMTPNNEVDKQINEGLNTLSQQTVTKLNALKSNQKNTNGEDIIVTSVVSGLSNNALGVPNGTEVYIKADNGKQSIVQYVDNNELKKAVIPNENLTNKTEELVSDMFFQYMDIASKTMYKTSAQSNQLIMEGLAEEDNMTTHDYSNKKAGHKIKYDGKEAVIQSVDTDNDGNKYADIELEDGAIVKAVPLRSVKNPKTVTFNIGKQQIELSKSNETGYFQTDILSKEKAETVKNGIQINEDYIAEIKEQPNPANPIEKGYRVTVREKTEEEKQDKNAVLNAFIADVQANGLYVRDKEGAIQIIDANEFDVNELTDKGELRITDKETGLQFVIPLENQQDLRDEYQQLQQQPEKEKPEAKTGEKPITEAKPETKVPITEPTYTELFEQTRDQYGLDIALQDIRDEITLKNQQLEEVNNKLKKASLKEKATLREQLQLINRELTELNNILKTQEDATQKRTITESNQPEYKGVEERQPEAREGEGEQRTTTKSETDSGDSVKPSEEEAINKKKESDIDNTEEPILKSRKEKGIFGNTIEELKKEIDSDNEDNPIGYMHNLGGMGSMSWRYVVKVNNHLVYFESYGRDGEETYVVEWIFEDPKLAEKTAKEYNGEAEEVYYGEENQRWIRFDNLDNALKYVLSLDNKKTEKEQQPAKEVWEMTIKEILQLYRKEPKLSIKNKNLYSSAKNIINEGMTVYGIPANEIPNWEYVLTNHKKEVEQALSEGKPVPEEVLKDYPELIQQIQEQAKTEEIEKPTLLDIEIQEQSPNINPSESQKKAGNYKKAHVSIQGMDISIENPKGSIRSGTDEDGKAWEHVMQSHYGYFLKTEGKDGDHIDVFIGENPKSDKIFVVDQINPKTKAFDESKVMLGYNTPEEAKAAYMENYDKDWQGFSAITEVPIEDFKKWAYDGKRQRKPFNEYQETPQPTETSSSEKPNNQQPELKQTGEQLSLFSTTSLDQSLTDLSSEERVKIVQDAIEQINDGKKVIIIDDMFSHLETKFKDSKVILERINNLRKINGDVTGFTIGDEITLNSNQATINKCIAAFEHERQHVENKEDKVWNDIKNDIAENIDNETLQKEVSALSGNSFYEGLSNNVLADEYIAYVIQMTFEGKEIKSSLKYKNIIQDEYRKRNGERLSILGRGTYPNIDAERRIGQNIVDNETGENRFLGSVSEGQEREVNEDIRFSVVTNEQQRKLVDMLNEISISEDVENAEESTNYRKAYIERYKALKDKLNAKNPNIVEIYQDVLKYLEALANDKTWSKWDKSAKPQLISIRNSVRELKKAGSIYGLKKKLEKALDIVLERQNETARKIIDNFVNQKLEGKKGKGVIIPKKVDAITRQFFDSMKEWMNKDSQSIENKLQNLRVAFNQKKEGNERDIIESQIKALTYIQNYKENITKQEDTISNIIIDINRLSKEYTLKDIRKDISSKYNTIASNKKKLDEVDERGKVDIIEANINLKKEIEAKQNEYKSIKQDIKLNKSDKAQLTGLKSLLLEERISMQNSMESFIKELDTVLKEGIKAKRIFAAKEEAKKQEILKGVYLEFAMSEMAIIVNPPLEESKKSILHHWLDPKYTFSSMLKDFGIHAPDGRGILYERFFTNGMLVARQKELTGLKEATKAVDEKITGIFGKENHISQVQKLCNDFNGAYVTIKTTVNKVNTESGKTESSVHEQIMELRNGQALYIYAIAKMNDGIVKLNAMGIDQEQIDSVTATLDPKLIEFIDWAQDEYLPLLREKYNITHLDLFGSQLDQIDKYFPLNIDLSGIPKEIDIEDTKAFKGLPTTATGAILKRSYNKYSVDIQNSDAIEIFIDHIQTMEKWNAYAPVIKELNILNSDNTFKKYVNRYIFNGAANQFKDVCAIAVGAYVPQESTVGSILTTLTKMFAISKISGRANTSLKQGLGMVQVLGEGNLEFTARVFKNFADPLTFKWAMDNLPLFEERWEGRTGGDDRLSLKGELSFIKSKKIVALMNKASNIGMLPNAAIDLFVSGVMAKSMYETKYNFYKERGYSEEESISKALKDAEIIYNETQQSAENLWLSKTQKDRTFLSASFSLFNNANFSYGRLFFEGLSTVGKQIKPKGRANLIAFQKARYIAEGRTPEVASKYAKNDVNRALSKGIMQIGLNGYFVQFVWNLGSTIGIMKALQYIMVFMSDDDKEKEIAFEELKDDIKSSAIKAVITPVRGLPGGKELESALELYLNGWTLKQISIQSNPLISDTKQAFEGMANGFKDNDWVKIVNSLVRYSSGFTGVDLNTIANITYGIYDLIENHENITTTDVLYDLSLIINSPKSEQKFLAISRRDDDTFEDIVNRYIELKRVHQYGVFSPLTKKEDSRAEQDVAKMINVRYYTLKEMLNEYDKAVETYNKFNPDNYIDLYQNASYERASTLKAELGYTAKKEMLDENQMNELKTAIEAMENDESLNEIYKKIKRSAWSTSRKKEPELE